MNSFSSKIAFVSAFVTAVTLAVVFKLCLVFTCQSLVYANAMLSTSFTLLVCLKMYEIQQADEQDNNINPQSVNPQSDEPNQPVSQKHDVVPQNFVNALSTIKDIQLSYVIPCIKMVVSDMYETFGFCVEPIYWLFEKYVQIVYPMDVINENTRIEYVTEFCESLTTAIDNNADINEFVKQIVRKFCQNILKMELSNPELRDVAKVIYALDMLTAELENMLDEDVDEQAVEEQAVEEQSVEEQAIDEQAIDEQSVEEQAVEEQAVEEQAVEEQSVEEQAVEDQADAKNNTNTDASAETISDDSIDYNLAKTK